MDREIIWLKAFVLIAFVFVVLFHGFLSKPATKINNRMQWSPEGLYGQWSASLYRIQT